ncbi:MAG: thioredoxin-disulfide reductase [Deltaproteobacteria bacterium]|nr:thioredoxin-disulfide reductase [Deltaproteobacteria bacterium]
MDFKVFSVQKRQKNNEDIRNVVIIGGGPAGLTAAIYSARAMLQPLLIEKGVMGGQAAITDILENYPGFPDGIGGPRLSELFEIQAKKFGTEIINDEVVSVRKDSDIFFVEGLDAEYKARSLIIATGASYKRLGVKGEEELIGRGISFCATCDGAFFKDAKIAVIGGGDSAVKEAIFLTKFAQEVYIIHRRDALRAEKIIQQQAFSNPKIKFKWKTIVEEFIGDESGIKKLRLRNVDSGDLYEEHFDGAFIFIGHRPNSEVFSGLVEMDENGFIITDESMRTSMEGVFAVGDVRKKALRQVITASADGAIAAYMVEEYLHKR